MSQTAILTGQNISTQTIAQTDLIPLTCNRTPSPTGSKTVDKIPFEFRRSVSLDASHEIKAANSVDKEVSL